MIEVIKAAAKINLFLHIVGKRSDGYHLLESLFAFSTSIQDSIEISPAEALSVNFIGAQINKTNNTVYKATKLLAEFVKVDPNFSIVINKQIPSSAGIGGGSTDAASVLKYLCKLWNVEITPEIYNIALRVGADVPACLYNKASLVTGIGENIAPIQNFPELTAVLVNPGIEVSTQEIFNRFSGNFTDSDSSKALIQENANILEIIKNSRNDLQEAAVSFCPEITDVISQIKAQSGCLVARMSGSGSTCFGIFENIESANNALFNLNKHFSWVKLTMLS